MDEQQAILPVEPEGALPVPDERDDALPVPAIEIRHRRSGEVIRMVAGDSLREADLRRADLQGADLQGADLRGANLQFANLIDVDVSGADLRGARVSGAYWNGALYDRQTRWPRLFHPWTAGCVFKRPPSELAPSAPPEGGGQEVAPASDTGPDPAPARDA